MSVCPALPSRPVTMVDAEEHVDPKTLTSLNDIKTAYDKLCREEVRRESVRGGTSVCWRGNSAVRSV